MEQCVRQETNDSFSALDQHLWRLSMGFKSDVWTFSKDVVAKNVVTMVESASKKSAQPKLHRQALDDVASHMLHLMDCYDLLSEAAHPNYMGTMEAYQKSPEPIDGDPTLFDKPALIDAEKVLIPIGYAATALGMMVDALEQWFRNREDFTLLLAAHQPPPAPTPKPNPAWEDVPSSPPLPEKPEPPTV